MDTTEQEEVLLPLKTNYQEQNLIYSEKKVEPSKRSWTTFFVWRAFQDEKSGLVMATRFNYFPLFIKSGLRDTLLGGSILITLQLFLVR